MLDLEETLDEKWAKLETDWEDDEAHDQFLKLCQGVERLDFAGKRYREVIDSNPNRAQKAQEGLDAVVSLAILQLNHGRNKDGNRDLARTRRILLLISVVLFIFAVIAMWLILSSSGVFPSNTF